jgi:hypothetical protein
MLLKLHVQEEGKIVQLHLHQAREWILMSHPISQHVSLHQKYFFSSLVAFLMDMCWPLTKFWEILGHVNLFWDFDSLSKDDQNTKWKSRDLNPFLGPFWVFGIM